MPSAGHVRHVLAERGRQVDLMLLLGHKDLANVLRHRVLAQRLALAHPRARSSLRRAMSWPRLTAVAPDAGSGGGARFLDGVMRAVMRIDCAYERRYGHRFARGLPGPPYWLLVVDSQSLPHLQPPHTMV